MLLKGEGDLASHIGGAAEHSTRYFYQPKPLRTLEEIRANILAVQREAEGLLDELVQGASK